MLQRVFFIIFFSLLSFFLYAQPKNQNLIYIDKQGVVRFTKTKKEASFFGVNYTVPFAYGYRSHKRLGVDIEKAIDADVHHMSMLGMTAFRVHVWDVELTDSLGNLLQNEHLRLFDFLLFKLKQKNIKILLTPIAFWGNGWPEPDEKTPGFATVYGKRNSVVLEPAIRAQENYMKQFYTHINPYTKISYKDDPDIIATEINNEPVHSGPKEKATEYINRLAAAIRKTGWTKPIFYNISESPTYADAVVKANVDGYSFQWYPTGLGGKQVVTRQLFT
jgi:endo-1,4-beta-mannosidase